MHRRRQQQHPLELIKPEECHDILEIPVLQENDIRSGKIKQNDMVKWRAIVRDVLGPQLITDPRDEDENNGRYVERLPLKCTVIPGETKWASELYTTNNVLQQTCESQQSAKSSKDDGRDALECIVHTYDTVVRSFKVNEMYEFVGRIDFESSEHESNALEDDELQILMGNQFDNQMPRLHCMTANPVDTFYMSQSPTTLHVSDYHKPSDNLSRVAFIQSAMPYELADGFDSVRELRSHLITYLSSILLGDELAAEYVLLCLLARVHARSDHLAVGQVPLNLMLRQLPPKHYDRFFSRLQKCLSALLPICEVLHLSTRELREQRLVPSKVGGSVCRCASVCFQRQCRTTSTMR